MEVETPSAQVGSFFRTLTIIPEQWGANDIHQWVCGILGFHKRFLTLTLQLRPLPHCLAASREGGGTDPWRWRLSCGGEEGGSMKAWPTNAAEMRAADKSQGIEDRNT